MTDRYALGLLAGCVLVLVLLVNGIAWAGHNPVPWLGVDFDNFREYGRRWLETGTMYAPQQTAGEYSVFWNYDRTTTPSMYPPAMGPVFGLLALLPYPVAAFVGWLLPVGIVGWALAQWRPAPWAWPLMALAFVLPLTGIAFLVGSSTLWAVALVALGLLYHWPAALLLLKPTFLPFALIGIRDPRWWIAAAVVAVLSIVGPWRDYLLVVRYGTDSGGFAYSLLQYPLMLIPILAYLGRTHDPSRAAPRRWPALLPDRLRGPVAVDPRRSAYDPVRYPILRADRVLRRPLRR